VRWLAMMALVATTSAGVWAADDAGLMDLRVTQQDGSAVALRDLVKDKPAVLAFWATYCAPCKAEVPVLNRAAERWGSSGLRVIGISLESDPARMREAREAWGIRYDVLPIVAGQDAATEKLFPRGLPAAAFVAGGKPTLQDRILDDATLDERVPKLLEHAPAPAQ
jgi:thiol-disulfide isomerase/thioredoxin